MAKLVQPQYITVQPSTNKKITFRPFTVKEEKALMLALQESDVETTTVAIKSIITACTELDPNKIPYYDVEYIYLQIRSKSIGEIINLVGTCECDPKAKTDFEVDVTSAVVEPKPEINKIIQIPDTQYSVKVTHPSIDDFSQLIKKNAENAEQIVANCITSVMTDDEVLDWSDAEKLEFVESMTQIQQKKIVEFMKTMPIVKLDTSYTCRACGKSHESKLSGFQNFFI